jgi:hypothetical protein
LRVDTELLEADDDDHDDDTRLGEVFLGPISAIGEGKKRA